MSPRAPDPRRLLADAWGELGEADREQVRGLALELWRETLSASKSKLVKGHVFECRKCGGRNLVDVPVEVPDVLTRARAFEILAREGFGAVPQRTHVEVDVGAVTLEALERMSRVELARIAGAGWDEVVDGEVLELEVGE